MYKRQILKVLKQNRELFQLGSEIKNFEVSKLGIGENNLSLLVEANKKKVVFRIGLRKEFEKNMKYEFDSLKILPHNFGPKPIYFDDSKKIINHTFSVLSYLPGKHITKWSLEHLKMHAKKLAYLHKKRYSYWGKFNERKKSRFDLSKEFDKDVIMFKKDYSIKKDKDLSVLYPLVKNYIKNNNHLFKELRKFSLIHSDPFSPNILFTKNDVHYIDWEWIKIGDNALDLAQLYSEDFSYPPWTIKLTGKRLKTFIGTYLKHIKDPTLLKRVRVWQVHIYFLDLVYMKWKLKNFHKEHAAYPKSYYIKLTEVISKSLKQKFLG